VPPAPSATASPSLRVDDSPSRAASAPPFLAPSLRPPTLDRPEAVPRQGDDATAAATSDNGLAREMENLARLRALEASNPDQALVVAADGDRQFPRGVFGEERQALVISALVRLGRKAEARARADAFHAAHPRSPFAERIRKLTLAAP